MTAHPKASDFLTLEFVCEKQMHQQPLTGEAHAAEAWFDHDRAVLLEKLDSVEVQPLAVLRVDHWTKIRLHYELFDLDISDGWILVDAPESWLQDFVVRSKAVGYEGQQTTMSKFSRDALLEVDDLSHKDQLLRLMPEYRTNVWDKDMVDAVNCFHIELPPAPSRESAVMHRLQAGTVPFRISADQSAIVFSPPLGEQMRGGNALVEEDARTWDKYEPIITVAEGSAVALVGQWGEYLFEKMAVQTAIQ